VDRDTTSSTAAGDAGGHGRAQDADRGEDQLRRMATSNATASASTASSDSVDALRRLVRDLKHDVRMLRVVVDRQSDLLGRLVDRLED
jgi:hypothetical protein